MNGKQWQKGFVSPFLKHQMEKAKENTKKLSVSFLYYTQTQKTRLIRMESTNLNSSTTIR